MTADPDKVPEGYSARTVMFGDGDKGAAMQIAKVTYKGEETGILITWSRKHRHEPGVTTYEYKGKSYASVHEAIGDYEEDRDDA